MFQKKKKLEDSWVKTEIVRKLFSRRIFMFNLRILNLNIILFIENSKNIIKTLK